MNMNTNVVVTCAVTGAGDTVDKHPAIPVTPEQIANSAIEAADAGGLPRHCPCRPAPRRRGGGFDQAVPGPAVGALAGPFGGAGAAVLTHVGGPDPGHAVGGGSKGRQMEPPV